MLPHLATLYPLVLSNVEVSFQGTTFTYLPEPAVVNLPAVNDDVPFLLKELLGAPPAQSDCKLKAQYRYPHRSASLAIESLLCFTLEAKQSAPKLTKAEGVREEQLNEWAHWLVLTAIKLTHPNSRVSLNPALTPAKDDEDSALKLKLRFPTLHVEIPVPAWNGTRSSTVSQDDPYPAMSLIYEEGPATRVLRRPEVTALSFVKLYGGTVGRQLGNAKWTFLAENWEQVPPLSSADISVSRPAKPGDRIVVELHVREKFSVKLIDVPRDVLLSNLFTDIAAYWATKDNLTLTRQLRETLNDVFKLGTSAH